MADLLRHEFRFPQGLSRIIRKYHLCHQWKSGHCYREPERNFTLERSQACSQETLPPPLTQKHPCNKKKELSQSSWFADFNVVEAKEDLSWSKYQRKLEKI